MANGVSTRDPLGARWLVAGTLVAFSALTGYAIWERGYWALWGVLTSNSSGAQVLVDLVIVCILVCRWMRIDARRRGINPLPFIALTIAVGSVGPLSYLLYRDAARSE